MGRKPRHIWPFLKEMPKPVDPIWFGDQCYACNPQGLHVPLGRLSVEEMRDAVGYRRAARDRRRAA